MGRKRVGRSHRQHRTDAESHGGEFPHFDAGGVERVRQFLAAPLRGRGEPVPTHARGPGAIGVLPTGRRGNRFAVLEGCTDAVANGVERGEHLGGEAARFRQHRVDHVLSEIAVEVLGEYRPKAGRMLERKGDVGNRRLIRHSGSFG